MDEDERPEPICPVCQTPPHAEMRPGPLAGQRHESDSSWTVAIFTPTPGGTLVENGAG